MFDPDAGDGVRCRVGADSVRPHRLDADRIASPVAGANWLPTLTELPGLVTWLADYPDAANTIDGAIGCLSDDQCNRTATLYLHGASLRALRAVLQSSPQGPLRRSEAMTVD